MLTAEQIELAETTARELPGQRQHQHQHQDVAIGILVHMIQRNLEHARRMVDLGDLNSTRQLLQSALSQVDQIASYQPKIQNRKIIEL